ncbi:MAG: tetratricopeptide repeat protein, partial [Dehalococcoidia bacterium]
ALKGATARLAAFRAKHDIAAGRYTAAVSQLSTAASKAPDDTRFKKDLANMYVGIAGHYKNEGADSLALSSFEKAYALDPTSTIARDNVAALSRTEGLAALTSLNYERAVEYLEKAYDTHRLSDDYAKDLARALDERGQRFVRSSDLDKALADLKRAVALDPSNSTIGQHYSDAYAKSLAS